ncbi:phosphate/phosphite/phosphonate ABC transporter substrate-binding protein [Prochlorothrix hollandica]|uniref:phosphate/phosphite/phosphonate ABC transporter substrate-binding protein n=1 Tax=Prochlorothrix hollandica TaxID=1223 RepID=UPI000349BB92|nr:phosphate/phosphite/phosphonate ABC transporter substrate-binding protein [Prochlorothrix hollandica]
MDSILPSPCRFPGRSLWVLVLLLLPSLGGCQSVSTSTPATSPTTDPATGITFGILSTESAEIQKPLWDPLLAAMATAIDQPVQGFYADQYSDLVAGLRSGEVQVAWLGGKAYIEAAQVAGTEAFAITVATDGAKGYTAHLIARNDQPWLAEAQAVGGDRYVLDHAAELTFAFNDPTSTSGFLVPNYYIFTRNGVKASDIFKAVRFEGDHEATALAVASGSVDVATNNSEALDRLAKSHPDAFSQLATLWISTLIPGDPIAYSSTLEEPVKEAVRTFFYQYKDEAVLTPLDWSGFEPATDDLWDPIRVLDLSQRLEEVSNNNQIEAAEKAKIIGELQQQLDLLNAKDKS